jgi:hypothetical protein
MFSCIVPLSIGKNRCPHPSFVLLISRTFEPIERYRGEVIDWPESDRCVCPAARRSRVSLGACCHIGPVGQLVSIIKFAPFVIAVL